ncbi:MAG: cytochrome c [Chloroflexi bacterium]|nr:cytochrome c [Chloroflexota bacterium]
MTQSRKGAIAGALAGLASVALAFAVSAIVRSAISAPSTNQSGLVTAGKATSTQGTHSSDAGHSAGVDTTTGGSTAGTISAAADPVTLGKMSYARNCAGCHGVNAQGGMGPDLRPHAAHSSAELGDAIRNGIKPMMPAFGGKLKKAEIDGLIAYIHSLKH